MNKDMIYRQDALDALGDKPETWNDTDYELGQVAQWHYDRTAIAKLPSAQPMQTDKDFEKQIHAMFDHIWDCEIEHPIFQDTVGDLMKAVIQAHNNSAQPEIIRCGQCKYAEVADKEDAQDGYTCQFHRGSIWFSGSYCSWAERKQE